MRVMQLAVRRMVKTAQKFARRTAAAVKMQVHTNFSCLCIHELDPPPLSCQLHYKMSLKPFRPSELPALH